MDSRDAIGKIAYAESVIGFGLHDQNQNVKFRTGLNFHLGMDYNPVNDGQRFKPV